MSSSEQKKSKKHPFLIVGIGASAGGLAVLKRFVKTLPDKPDMAFIIVQHLDPTHKSMLGELLAKESRLTVSNAKDGQVVEANKVYVIPPDTYLEITGGKLKLTTPEVIRGLRKAIDHLFRSLARECGDLCAGIVLSGSGGDGTAGLREIKAAGGLSLVQDPDAATHSSMPSTAINAHVVDEICRVEEMYEVLTRFTNHPDLFKKKESKAAEEVQKSLEEISAILKTYEDFNLSQYKPPTVMRRIARRMSLTNISEYPAYLQKLREDEYERKQLTKDLLINVTDFFRDGEAFNILESKIIPDIVDNLTPGEDVRIWVPGCASGEEAYSLAILFIEALEKAQKKNDIKIFATDIDEQAIQIARRGQYPIGIAGEVPEKYLEKYFIQTENDHRYKVRSGVRDLISFANQDVANDPPFNHMHLISCRNLLIYLNREVQEDIFSSFYFSLKNHHYLFLGSSEALGTKSKLFKTTSKKWRIYQKIPGKQERQKLYDQVPLKHTSGRKRSATFGPERRRRETNSRGDMMRKSIMEVATPPTILIDETGQVLYSHGDLTPFVDFPKGEPRYDIVKIIKPYLRSRLRSTLYKVKKVAEPISFYCPVEEGDRAKESALVTITPDRDPDYADGQAYIIVFSRIANRENSPEPAQVWEEESKMNMELELELAETREELQNTIEELETNTEELKAAHEESLSTNEELQSSNEELEASSEELRSLNEELSTVNEQLKAKIDELKRANDDAENFFTSTNLPMIFLDPELKIQRYTPAAEQLLKMGPGDLGRKINTLGRELVSHDLKESCREVLRTFQPERKEVEDHNGNCYLRQLTPYRTEDRRVAGVVLVFQDFTELMELSRRAEGREKQQAVVAKLGMLALTGTEPIELMHQAVRQVAHVLEADYCKVLQYNREENNMLMVSGVGWQEGLVGRATVPDDQYSQAGYTLANQEPVIVDDLKTEKRFSGPDLLTDHYVTSGISCIINHSDPPFGVIGVHTKKHHNFSVDDANFVQSVANMLSTAIKTKEAQILLHESEMKFRTMANSIPQLAWMTDQTGFIFWYNRRWYDYTGTDYEEMKGWGWKSVHHADHVDGVVERFKAHVEKGEIWEDTFPLRSKEGEYRWFLSRAEPIRDQEGNIARWFGTNTDITDKLNQEKELNQSLERLKLAKESAKLGMFDYDLENDQIEWEPLLYEIWGIDSKEPISMDTFYSGLYPDDIESTKKAVEKALDSKRGGHYETVYRVINKKTRKLSWVKASGFVLFEDGKAERMIGMVNDITELKQAEEEAIKNRNLLDAVTDIIPNPLFVKDVERRLLFANRATYEAAQKKSDEIISKKDEDWIEDADVANQVKEHDQAVLRTGIPQEFEEKIIGPDGVERTFIGTKSPWRNDQGDLIGLVGGFTDITDRKELETSLKKALDELREADMRKNDFLSILGHELRNPLAALSGCFDILKKDNTEDDKLFSVVDHSIHTMSGLLDDLLDLNRISENRIVLEKTDVQIKTLLEAVIRSIDKSGALGRHEIDVDLADDLWARGDAMRLEQVFSNIIINACKYTLEGGRIEVSARKEKGKIVVEVTDNGMGIPEPYLERVFDPFYQIKPEGQASEGLGIGLALAKNLIEMHEGTIKASSGGKDQGTTFTVELPPLQMLSSKKNNGSAKKTTTDSKPEGLKVLLIEDNDDILLIMPRVLKRMGCEVETAKTGREGIDKVKTFKPDAAVVDIGLPDIDGHEVAKSLRVQGYKGLLIALSGYSHKEIREKSKEVGFDHHLAKPANLDELKEVLFSRHEIKS